MAILVDPTVMVPVRDGARLATDVYRDAAGRPAPALLLRTPYGREQALVSPYFEGLRLARAGLALVIQDVRGRGASDGASDGTFTPFAHEARDGSDTIAWIRSQPWCSGRVGMFGPSYSGVAQWLAAAEAPDGLACISPIMAPANLRDGWIRRGAVFELGFNVWWGLSLGLDVVERRSSGGQSSGGAAASPTRDDVLDALDRLPEIYRASDPTAEPIVRDVAPFLGDWFRSSGRGADAAAPELAGVPAVAFDRVAAPALIVSGWYDVFLRGALASYHAIRAGSNEPDRRPRLIVGPWTHNVGGGVFDDRDFGARSSLANAGIVDELERWFRRWLLDEPPPPDNVGPVRLFVMGADEWRTFHDWPPQSRPATLFLHADGDARTRFGDGRLVASPPTGWEPDAFDVDPADRVPTTGGAVLLAGAFVGARAGPRDRRAVEERPDILCYVTDPLLNDVEMIGPIVVRLWVSSTAPTMDFTGVLVQVAPDGRAEIVADGIVRVELLPDSTDHPGAVACLIDLGATAIVIPRGHRIRLEVASSDAPRFDRPGRGTGRDDVARNTVFHDAERPSALVLPVTSGSL